MAQGGRIDWGAARSMAGQAQSSTPINWAAARQMQPEVGAGTIAESALSSIGGGAIGTLGAGLEGLGLLADKIEQYLPESWQRPGSPFRETGVAMQEYGASLGAEARQQVQAAGGATKFLGSTVPEAIGSSAAFGATALATGGLGGAAMGTGAIAITGAAAGASQGYNDAKAHGASEEDAWTSALINGGMGTTEAIPIGGIIGRLLKRTPRSVGKIVVDALKEGGGEMAQETSQQIVGNLTAKYWAGYEEDRDILKGVAEQGGAGALTGFLMSLVGGSAGTLMQRRAQAQEQAQAGLAKAGPAEPGAQKQAFDPLAHTIPPMAQGEQGTPQEAAGAPESAPAGAGLAVLESRVNRQAEEMEAATGQPQPRTIVRPVAPATTEEQDDTDFASDYGVKLTLVEGDKGPLQFPGMHTTGEVFVDRNLPSPLRRRMVLVHELVHELGAVDRPALDALVADFTKVDPEGMANAQAATAKDWEAATGDTYGPGVLEEETIARRVETLGRWLDEGLRNPERFSQALLADKTVFERFRDAVSRLLQRVGFKGLKSSQQVRIEKLIEELGQPATGDARKTIALVQKVEQALNILRGRAVAARTENPAQQRAQPDVGSEKTNSEATPSKAALEQDLTAQAEGEPGPRFEAATLVAPWQRLKTMLRTNLAEERRLASEILPAELGYDEKQVANYLDLVRKAREEGNPEQESAAKQVRAVQEQLRPRALKQLMTPGSGFASEDIIRAMRAREAESQAGKASALEGVERRAQKRESKQAEAQAHREKLGTDPRFAVSPQGPSNVTVPEHTKTDRLSASFGQYLRRVETLRSAFGVSTDLVNWFERMPGRTKHLLKEWEKRNLKPVKDLLKQYDIEAWEAGRYLFALHVPDANALAAKRHPRKYGKASNPGSGMTNAEAAKIVTEYESDPKRAAGFKSIAGINRRMGEEKLKVMVAAGLVPQDVADQWRADLGPNYVSLANLDYDPDSRGFIPSSRSGVKGKESRSRQGRMSRADFSNIIPMTWSAAAEKIVRAEHNAVAQQVGEFVKEMKRDDIAEIVVNAQGVATKPNTKEGEEVFSYKEKGHDVHIVIRDKALADALKRMKMEFGGPILKALSHAMALWRGMRTTYNPEWFLSNLPSDLGDAIITIQREGKKSLGRKILKNIKPAVQAAWHAEHDTGTKTAYSAILQEAEENGALIGLIDLKGPQRIKAEFGSKAQDMTRPVKDAFAWLEATSSTFEKGVRLSIYKTMRDAGLTPFDAARVARETTTPFVRKGNYSPMMGLLYAFFNAKVQGMLIVKSALKSKQARNVLFAAIAIDFTIAAMNRALMGDDEEGRDRYDKVRKDKKTNQVFFGVPGSEMGFGWRAPRSYLWAHQFAVGLEALLFGNDYDAGEFGRDMLVSVVDAAVPFDTSGSLWQAMAPTAVDPGVQLLENKDFAGNAINPHDFPEDRRPDSEKAFKNASPSAKALAEFVNLVTGGDEVKPGLVSVKPGTVEHWVSFMLGGIGDTASRLIDLPEKIASGAISANDIPLARKLVTTADPRYEQREFYEGVTKVLNVVNLVGDYVKAGKLDEAKAIREEYPVEWSLRFRADIARKNVAKWRDQMEQADDARREQIQERIDGIMREFNVKADETRKKHAP